MLTHKTEICPRYGEVDAMGYVYHANYVSYCHQARTELMRSMGIQDKVLEQNGILLPVIEMNLKYHSPSGYDEPLSIVVSIDELPKTRLVFSFKITSSEKLVCTASSTVVFADSITRKPLRAPQMVISAFKKALKFQVVE
jgi:acyl-CoA thioester hydrolase